MLCLAERERDPSGCRASGLSPELPVHVVLVPPLLVPPPSHAMVVTKKLWIPRAGHRIVQSTLLLSFFCCIGGMGPTGADVYSTDTNKTQFNSSRHNGYQVASWVHDIEECKGSQLVAQLNGCGSSKSQACARRPLCADDGLTPVPCTSLCRVPN